MTEFVALGPKTYSYLIDDSNGDRKLKEGKIWNLNHLVEPNFQGINILFVLSFEDDAQRRSNKRLSSER